MAVLIGTLGQPLTRTMEFATIAALVLLVVSEVLPFTPLKGNGLVEEILVVLRKVFPHRTDSDVK